MASILVVDDENLEAMQLAWMIEDAGHFVVGPESCVATASKVLERQMIDLAVLDLHLRGETAFPVADMLDSRGIPYVFITSERVSGLPPAYRDRPLIAKPCQPEILLA